MGARMDYLAQPKAAVAWSKVANGDVVMIPSKRAMRNGVLVFVGSGLETRIGDAGEVIHALDGQVKPAKAVVVGIAQSGWTGPEGDNLPQDVRSPEAKAMAAAAKPKARKAAKAKADAPIALTEESLTAIIATAVAAALKAQA